MDYISEKKIARDSPTLVLATMFFLALTNEHNYPNLW